MANAIYLNDARSNRNFDKTAFESLDVINYGAARPKRSVAAVDAVLRARLYESGRIEHNGLHVP